MEVPYKSVSNGILTKRGSIRLNPENSSEMEAKVRRRLGLVGFVGELFKDNMIIEKMMYALRVLADFRYERVIRLLGATDNPQPDREDLEELCILLKSVSRRLDEGKARNRMTAVHEALDNIRMHGNLEPQIKFELLVYISPCLYFRTFSSCGNADGLRQVQSLINNVQ
jgi:hypothetical protein